MDNGGYRQDPEKGTELDLVEKATTRLPGASGKAGKFDPLTDSPSNENESSAAQSDHQSPGSPASPGASGGVGGGGGSGQEPEPGPSTSCRPEVCQRARERYTAPDLRGSPWHRSKTIFLLITIGSLIIWAIIYGALSKYNLV